jgi:SAM-dependent methyltransferase
METLALSLKDMVREKYATIATQSKENNQNSCCGVGSAGTYTIMADSYEHLNGYNADADLGLGCGLPTEFARIQKGDVVLDLGSGAGNDCFVARAETGATGKVIGVDFTPEMIDRARLNADKLGYNNVEFRQGDIEHLPIGDATIDVIVSNCVLNLVPNKTKAFSEIKRVLKNGGHFSVSDVVLIGELPEGLKQSAELYAGCVSGAIQLEEYMDLIEKTGFANIKIQKQKPILVPDHILLEHLSEAELKDFLMSGTGIFSITVYAEKGVKITKPTPISIELPLAKACCPPNSGCC